MNLINSNVSNDVFLKNNIFNHFKILILVMVFFGLLGCCEDNSMKTSAIKFQSINDIPQEKWEKLAQKRIFFGHQSVGFNILNGLNLIMADNPHIKLNIVHTSDAENFADALFAHEWIGENTKPKSKIDAFDNVLRNGVGDKVDIAFMKFCYVDITSSTDVDKVFSDYNKILSGLESSFPGVTFIHVTTPLTSVPTGIDALLQTAKNLVKKILGKPVFDYKDNINRNDFNEKLLSKYNAKNYVFDLARIEYILPDGSVSSFTKNGRNYYSLAADYTYDGGHLNEKGSKKAAEQLLVFLAQFR